MFLLIKICSSNLRANFVSEISRLKNLCLRNVAISFSVKYMRAQKVHELQSMPSAKKTLGFATVR